MTPNESADISLEKPPFSPLGWSVPLRLGFAALACALMWAVIWWAL